MQAPNHPAPSHPLEPFFQQAVRNSYEGKLYQVRDEMGHPIEELDEMMLAADPVHGTAPSFDAERALRKHIGDYALFVAGMYPEAAGSSRRLRHGSPSLAELIRTGKESYFIVSSS